MLLIGMFDSPFVRRVAVSMQRLDIGYQHADWSVGKDFDRIRAYNPLGRVPTLVLGDGEVLCESAAIAQSYRTTGRIINHKNSPCGSITHGGSGRIPGSIARE